MECELGRRNALLHEATRRDLDLGGRVEVDHVTSSGRREAGRWFVVTTRDQFTRLGLRSASYIASLNLPAGPSASRIAVSSSSIADTLAFVVRSNASAALL